MSGFRLSDEQRMLLNIGNDEYGDHLAGIAESIVAEAVEAARAEDQRTIADLREGYRDAIGVPPSRHQRERLEAMATALEAARAEAKAEGAERALREADTALRVQESIAGERELSDRNAYLRRTVWTRAREVVAALRLGVTTSATPKSSDLSGFANENPNGGTR